MEEINYKILIVDENETQIDDFKDFVESLSKDILVFGLSALKDENDLLQFVVENEIEAVAFDYKLKENNSSFAQNGDAYQIALLETFENFPTFIITNNPADSKSMRTDPFKIIDKRIINFDSEKTEQKFEAEQLIEKIKQSIDTYKETISSYENELYDLIDKQQNPTLELTDEEIKRMVDLDSRLENSVSKRAKIPKEWKSPAAIEEIIHMVENSEEILTELKKLNNE